MKAKDNLFKVKSTLNICGNLMDLGTPKIMGILNVTPDSFYSGSRSQEVASSIQIGQAILSAGADILDIGGYSTRPGADDISLEEELNRVIPVIKGIASECPEAIISIDTFRSEVARKAVEAGASIINDVSGGNLDDQIFQTVAELDVPYILMHMRGTPQTMKELNDYDHLLNDIAKELEEKKQRLLKLGVSDIVIDPGFGFAKNISQNYEILRNLGYLKRLKLPILAGVSRKSMVYKTLKLSPEEALNGTTALNMAALINGASILRVHDVKEAAETVKLFQAYKG